MGSAGFIAIWSNRSSYFLLYLQSNVPIIDRPILFLTICSQFHRLKAKTILLLLLLLPVTLHDINTGKDRKKALDKADLT